MQTIKTHTSLKVIWICFRRLALSGTTLSASVYISRARSSLFRFRNVFPLSFSCCMFSCSRLSANKNTDRRYYKLEVTEMKICKWTGGDTQRYHVRNDDIRERLPVENITERCRKGRLRWFGHVKRPRLRRKTNAGDGTTWEKTPEAELDGLCQPRHESYRDDRRWSTWQNWLEENCVGRIDPTVTSKSD